MDKFTTEIIQTLAQNGNISEIFRSHLGFDQARAELEVMFDR